ncbi:MAG: SufD family Fe-S cluster assembly protein [Lachnospiraceae bacterium]|nr:SufD family Fe-S cluster assembly protein [Lachnospiraceae bacterium]
MNTSENAKINILPVPTWNHLRVNEAVYEGVRTVEEIFEGLEKVEISPTDETPVVYDFKADGSVKGVDFDLKINTDSTIILRFTADDNLYGERDVTVRIGSNIKEGRKLHLVIVNLTKNARFYAASDAVCEKESALTMTTVSLGSSKAYLEGKVKLQGESSNFDTYTAYILEKGQFLDMNYVADHTGKNTEANIVSAGVLNEKTQKVSRQTVNFIAGCAGSKGAENEEVLLLDDDVINKSAPLILCTEEDVEGEHGASIGQPDEDVIFYLKSRGLAIEKIYEMLSIAKVEAALSRIDHQETKKLVRDFLEIKEEEE